MIQVLDQNTIDKIAAGEVIERPAAVVKELVENAIDAGANAVTVEIREGGIRFIRITDNGCGIRREEIPLAFLRHATSKIRSVEDLFRVKSLGFRGEALSSIAAVSQVELITKEAGSIIGSRYEIQGGEETANDEVGCPDGTTFIVRNLFYNTPARGNFLKSKTTEGGYISDVVLHFILSHPEIRFKFIWDGKTKIQTSGNGNIKDNIFNQFGADITKALLPVEAQKDEMRLTGYVGKPELSRNTRTFMYYYINGRYIKSPVVQKAIESAYEGFSMKNRFPFTALFLEIDSSLLDVNVHPSKMEVRFTNQEDVFELFRTGVRQALNQAVLIPKVPVGEKSGAASGKTAQQQKPKLQTDKPQPDPKQVMQPGKKPDKPQPNPKQMIQPEPFETRQVQTEQKPDKPQPAGPQPDPKQMIQPGPFETRQVQAGQKPAAAYEQQTLPEHAVFKEEAPASFRLVGQVFGTYWLVEWNEEMLIIDQHAAHEKVLYEKIRKELAGSRVYSQNLLTPIMLTLTHREKEVLQTCREAFETLGFEIEEFGGDEYVVKAVPSHFLHMASRELFYSILDELLDNPLAQKNEMITDRCATIACKAAVKGNHTLSFAEAEQLLAQLMDADEPYHCPHGRPTMISMTKKEFEKKFKRIV